MNITNGQEIGKISGMRHFPLSVGPQTWLLDLADCGMLRFKATIFSAPE